MNRIEPNERISFTNGQKNKNENHRLVHIVARPTGDGRQSERSEFHTTIEYRAAWSNDGGNDAIAILLNRKTLALALQSAMHPRTTCPNQLESRQKDKNRIDLVHSSHTNTKNYSFRFSSAAASSSSYNWWKCEFLHFTSSMTRAIHCGECATNSWPVLICICADNKLNGRDRDQPNNNCMLKNLLNVIKQMKVSK